MGDAAQKRAVSAYRERLTRRGVTRFEVLARESDRELIRSLAKRLAADGADASEIRDAIRRAMETDVPRKGGILAALRRSPLVGAEVRFERPRIAGRRIAW
jgi:hypothetical protein